MRFSTHKNCNITVSLIAGCSIPPNTTLKIGRNLTTYGTKLAVLPLLCFDCHVLYGGTTNHGAVNTKHMAVSWEIPAQITKFLPALSLKLTSAT